MKRIRMALLLIMLCLTAFFIQTAGQKTQIKVYEDGIYIQTSAGQGEKVISAYRDDSDGDGIYYFFLPAFVEGNQIETETDRVSVYQGGGEQIDKNGHFKWSEGVIYTLKVKETDKEAADEYQVVFLRSKNLPAVFIETDSGSMDYLLADKDNEEPGDIEIILPDQNTEYAGGLGRISGRGNTTWTSYNKKSFSISLDKAAPLCGMDKGRKWRLLALAREGTKLQTKLVMDIGEALGMDYTPQGSFVDLYLNGEYAGLYLLCESVSVGEGRVDIYDLEEENERLNPDIENAAPYMCENKKGYVLADVKTLEGGYLLEKDAVYYEESGSGFMTDNGDGFRVREPEYASVEQIDYISQYIRDIDDMLNHRIEESKDHIAWDSFIEKFLVDEISMNHDAYLTSAYFYKDKNEDLLYAGPLWDYDLSMGIGEGRSDYLMVEYPGEGVLNWFFLLYHYQPYYEAVRERYTELLPYLEELLSDRIDEYAGYISAAEAMDEIRWRQEALEGDTYGYWGYYGAFESNVDFLKYFLTNRINYLNDQWDIAHDPFPIPSDGDYHEVTFVKNGEVVDTRQVMDGAVIEDIPALEEGYAGWYFPYAERIYWNYLPIYEDTVFTAG